MNWKKISIKLLAGLFSVLLLVSVLPQTAHAETALATGYVNTTKLNMRSGAGTRNAIVATLSKNDAVNVYEVSGTWLRIDVPSIGKSGYVSGKYISINSSSLSAYAIGVTTGRVNLRKDASSKSESLAVVDSKAGVTVYSADKTTGWYKVKVHSTGKEGYISPKYVTIIAKVVGASSSTSASGTGKINANNVNFRKTASTKGTKLGQLQKQAEVTILEKSGDWYKVTVKATGVTGYVYAKFVTLDSSTSPTPTPVLSTSNGYINAGGVNFRSGPSASYSSLGILSKNTAVNVLEKSGTWVKVTVTSTGKTGYVFGKYVTMNPATPTPTTTPTPKPTVTPTVVPTAVPTVTPSPTPIPTPTPTPTAVPTPTTVPTVKP